MNKDIFTKKIILSDNLEAQVNAVGPQAVIKNRENMARGASPQVAAELLEEAGAVKEKYGIR